MRETETVVIVGAGLAGHSAAETLRREGFAGRIILFGREPERPYDRPPLSKEFLKGEIDKDSLYYRSRSAYDKQGIELRLNTSVNGIDANRQLVFTADRASILYDHLLIATGGHPTRLRVPGSDLAGIHYLRTMADAREIASQFLTGNRLLVVGAGFIGCELAAAARALKIEVTVLEALPHPMANVFGPEIGAFFAAEHRKHGVNLRLNEGLLEFIGRDHVSAAVSSKGNIFECTAVVVGVGLTPAVEIVKSTPIVVDNGIVVDEYCRTIIPNIYAAGDVANWWHPGLKQRIRVEHWENASKQAETAARNMLGQNEVYAPVPYFWSDQYDLRLQLFGRIPKDLQPEITLRGSFSERAFNLYYQVEQRIVAAVSVNRNKDARNAVGLIERGVEVDPALLADTSVDICSLAKD